VPGAPVGRAGGRRRRVRRRAPAGGTLSAFLRFVRCGEGLSLDVMRRSGEAPNGLYESMIVAMLKWARARGIHAVSLNFAGFSHVMSDRRELTRSERLLRFALTQAHGRF